MTDELDVIEKGLNAALGTHGDRCYALVAFDTAIAALATVRQQIARGDERVEHLEGALREILSRFDDPSTISDALALARAALSSPQSAQGQPSSPSTSDDLRGHPVAVSDACSQEDASAGPPKRAVKIGAEYTALMERTAARVDKWPAWKKGDGSAIAPQTEAPQPRPWDAGYAESQLKESTLRPGWLYRQDAHIASEAPLSPGERAEKAPLPDTKTKGREPYCARCKFKHGGDCATI